MAKERKKRWIPTWPVGILLGLILAVIVWIRWTDPMGDRGSINVFTMMLTGLAVVVWVLWFALASGQPWKVRLVPLALVVVAVAIFQTFFRLDHFSGEMIPVIVPKSAPPPDRELQAPAVPGMEATVDLATTTPDDFPQFLGPRRDTAVEHVRLARDWEARPPEMLWKREIGAGWSGFAVVNDVAVTLEQRGDEELVTSYDVVSGEPLWSHATPGRYELTIAGTGPRATPTLDDGWVYAQGATGRLVALDGADGSLQWEKDLLAEYGMSAEQEAKELPYGRSGSPLIVGDLVVVPAGGPSDGRKASLVAYHKKTGEKVWEGGDQQISCSSPTVTELLGVEQVVIVNEATFSGHDVATGEELWQHPWGEGKSNTNANVSQAMPLPPNRVFLSKGYGTGAALFELSRDASGRFAVTELWSDNRVLRTKFTNVAILDGTVYGLSDGILEAVDLATGERRWKGGRYRQGQILRVRDLLLVLAESGEVFLVEASPERRNNVLGQFQAIEGKTWNNPALYGEYLLVRNAEEAACFRLPLAG